MTRVIALGKIGKRKVRREEPVLERQTRRGGSLGLGDGLDEKLSIAAIREGERHLIVDVDVLQKVRFIDLEHHGHGFHVVRDVFVRDGDVVLLFANGANFSTCRVCLARRAARRCTSFPSLFLGFRACGSWSEAKKQAERNEKRCSDMGFGCEHGGGVPPQARKRNVSRGHGR